jgi:16S rRNA G966 N2-methylase RsmD
VWLLGPHRLLCGDATKEQSYRVLMGEERAQMVFTDPPYGANRKCFSVRSRTESGHAVEVLGLPLLTKADIRVSRKRQMLLTPSLPH